jgi:hypothetical protein
MILQLLFGTDNGLRLEVEMEQRKANMITGANAARRVSFQFERVGLPASLSSAVRRLVGTARHDPLMLRSKTTIYSGALLAAWLALLGCNRSKGWYCHKVLLGDFSPSSKGSQVEGKFEFPTAPTNAVLGFSVLNFVQPGETNGKEVVDRVLALANQLQTNGPRLRLQLFLGGSTNDFFCAEFQANVGGNCFLYPRITGSDVDVYFDRVELLPYGHEENLRGEAIATYRLREGEEAMSGRKLIPGKEYRTKLTVLDPTSLTNPCKLWLLNYYSPKSEASR